MTDDLVKSTDKRGREIFVYAKGKAPKERARYSTRPVTGEVEAPATPAKPATSKPEPEKE